MKTFNSYFIAFQRLPAAFVAILAWATPLLPVAAVTVAGLSAQAEAASNSRRLLQQARSGDVDAMRRLAKALWTGTVGRGVDRHNAIKWWKKAAEKGDSRSMVILGDFYAQGIYFDKNIDKALLYYERAIKAGNKTAEKHYIQLVRVAAQEGDANAIYALGKGYENGYGVASNAQEALQWYQKAAKKGHPKAQKKVLPLLERDAEEGNPATMRELAQLYESGTSSIPRNIIKSLYWYNALE